MWGLAFTARTHEFAVDLHTSVRLDVDLSWARCKVRDGLGTLSTAIRNDNPHGAKPEKFIHAPSQVRDSRLLGFPGIRSISLASRACMSVLYKDWVMQPAVRSAVVDSPAMAAKIRAASCHRDRPAVIGVIERTTGVRTKIGDGLRRIHFVPMRLRSMDTEMLSMSVCDGYLREAVILKGVPEGQGELLAVFRKVPIELVTRMRFIEGKRMILFTLALPRTLRRTRLHDLAAVRDLSTKEVHLVAHRTRYQTVFLN
jgi:hypothetical protein